MTGMAMVYLGLEMTEGIKELGGRISSTEIVRRLLLSVRGIQSSMTMVIESNA